MARPELRLWLRAWPARQPVARPRADWPGVPRGRASALRQAVCPLRASVRRRASSGLGRRRHVGRRGEGGVSAASTGGVCCQATAPANVSTGGPAERHGQQTSRAAPSSGNRRHTLSFLGYERQNVVGYAGHNGTSFELPGNRQVKIPMSPTESASGYKKGGYGRQALNRSTVTDRAAEGLIVTPPC